MLCVRARNHPLFPGRHPSLLSQSKRYRPRSPRPPTTGRRTETDTAAAKIELLGPTVPTANPIWGRRWPAHICCKSDVRLSSPATIEKHEKSTLRIANKVVLSCREARIGTPVPGLELPRGLLRSGCASLVAVMKSANLRYGNDGSEFQRLHGPRFRCF